MKQLDAWLVSLIDGLHAADRPLADELRAIQDAHRVRRVARGASRALHAALETRAAVRASVRNIVLRVGRPVLAIVGGAAQLTFKDSESAIWRARLKAARVPLHRAALAVGRIDVTGLADLDYVGTGWLVADNTIITNRHVALEFARKNRGRFAFRPEMGASVDFLEESGRRQKPSFPILDILHIEDAAGPDFALLRVGSTSGRHTLAPPIPLASARPSRQQQVAIIGYPARDSRVPDMKLMHQIFGDVYDKKRLAPGQLTDVKRDVLWHDCSTLGGNSGSVLVDLTTGEAAGLHFAGRFLETNLAVPAAIVRDRVDAVLRHKPSKPHPATPSKVNAAVPPTRPGAATAPGVFVEATVADYTNRKGYDPAFVGSKVPLPIVKRGTDILTFTVDGRQASELKYQHFSVVMNRARRLCIFSAGNIDGKTPQRFKRPAWRLDPRIPTAQQIRDECYGNEPLFARGHMTRREDPIWGTLDEASLGNADSMHVTNTVPQMQPFNAGIWLALESYALDHARSDQMRISVFTGPFLLDDDPVRVGVKIPRSFWKVIAFIHDETGKLCATGYTMSQEDFLKDEEFVFGQHKTSQTRIATIEQKAGLSFGRLTALDPFHDDQEGVATVLTDPSQIQFV